MYIPVTGSVSYNPIMKDYSVVCLEAKEAILVNLLTEKKTLNLWALLTQSMSFIYNKLFFMIAGGFRLFFRS